MLEIVINIVGAFFAGVGLVIFCADLPDYDARRIRLVIPYWGGLAIFVVLVFTILLENPTLTTGVFFLLGVVAWTVLLAAIDERRHPYAEFKL